MEEGKRREGRRGTDVISSRSPRHPQEVALHASIRTFFGVKSDKQSPNGPMIRWGAGAGAVLSAMRRRGELDPPTSLTGGGGFPDPSTIAPRLFSSSSSPRGFRGVGYDTSTTHRRSFPPPSRPSKGLGAQWTARWAEGVAVLGPLITGSLRDDEHRVEMTDEWCSREREKDPPASLSPSPPAI